MSKTSHSKDIPNELRRHQGRLETITTDSLEVPVQRHTEKGTPFPQGIGSTSPNGPFLLQRRTKVIAAMGGRDYIYSSLPFTVRILLLFRKIRPDE